MSDGRDLTLVILLIILLIVIIYRLHQRMIIEPFHQIKTLNLRSRSVELSNPSAYTGMFARRYEVPDAYTQTLSTFPLNNPLHPTKWYDPRSRQLPPNLIMSPWNIHQVYPHQNRRLMLI